MTTLKEFAELYMGEHHLGCDPNTGPHYMMEQAAEGILITEVFLIEPNKYVHMDSIVCNVIVGGSPVYCVDKDSILGKRGLL